MLKVQGQEVVSPNQRKGLHPLAIPLTKGPPLSADADSSVTGNEVFTCLLRWPASAASQVSFQERQAHHDVQDKSIVSMPGDLRTVSCGELHLQSFSKHQQKPRK